MAITYGFRPSSGEAVRRARRGLTWLKEQGPFYGFDYTRIDPDTVSVMDPTRCPLAQASFRGRYSAAISRIMSDPNRYEWINRYGFDDPNEWITGCGFDVSPWDSADTYARLGYAWRQVLHQDLLDRKAAAA
jgi:hypothetical protein